MSWITAVVIIVALWLLLGAAEQEQYTRTPTYLVPNRCTDGCIYRQRNRGVFVDTQCMSMCNDQWDFTKQGPVALDPYQQNQRYYNNVIDSIASGAFVYDDGLLS